MTKRRNRQTRTDWKESVFIADAVVTALQTRAREITKEWGHDLGHWQSAKKRLGKGARINWCAKCAGDVIILPQGRPQMRDKVPTLIGEILFEACD